eukprot:CAMPEP_0178445460 /NCGR_PEP_ID=MMETSP0689_2-20121128/40177_1 /TAXON_ID=160604 /ORGANISM="Amphidinium massartii, Strain CS-259" /LENGTH=216 /DNA_ID=CAMNT_0020070009 /DNA_START=111 /DNA_END=757 /DNA_ORIENTATION=+
MLFSPDMLVPTGPPPQAIIDDRWLWQILLFLLGLTLALRLIGLDVAGALLAGLMLCFGFIMIRDGMQEISKYALVYAVLCGLNFFFDILPLLTEIGGRVTRETEPVETGDTQVDGNGEVQSTMYRLTIRTTPFIDFSQGIVYNAQSFAMIVSPIAMALGVYLSMSAHNEIQRHAPPIFDDDLQAFALPARQPQGQRQDRERRTRSPDSEPEGRRSR